MVILSIEHSSPTHLLFEAANQNKERWRIKAAYFRQGLHNDLV